MTGNAKAPQIKNLVFGKFLDYFIYYFFVQTSCERTSAFREINPPVIGAAQGKQPF